jgi:hypothetical protein
MNANLIFRWIAAALSAAVLISCETSQNSSVALYKSDNAAMDQANSHNPDYWINRGLNPTGSQMQ